MLRELTTRVMMNREKDLANESDEEELSEGNYEKDNYEVEVQAFMARGRGERQERAEA